MIWNPTGFLVQAESQNFKRSWNIMTIKTFLVTMCMSGLMPLALAQNATPAKVTAADAKNHVGETATVCGKVVDNKVSKYGLAGHGKPVSFDIDQPEPNPVFYFVTFGSQAGGPDEVLAAYQGKKVCVTGKITMTANLPLIMAADHAQIKVQPEGK
jgi:hypothetical protein